MGFLAKSVGNTIKNKIPFMLILLNCVLLKLIYIKINLCVTEIELLSKVVP